MATDKKPLSTEPYKGVRDFYPEDMEVQNYIFSVWRKVSEEFGYKEYSASPLEYAALYRNKGSDEIVNDQMYVFTDKGDREVALRPEMTPTLARMIAAKRKVLKFPVRWYSIPNVFRYERPQRGRKREHWQLNCDLMGEIDKNPTNAEVEIISLAYKIMKEFGAKDGDFQIQVNNRAGTEAEIKKHLLDATRLPDAMRLLDKKSKITDAEFNTQWKELTGKDSLAPWKNPEIDALTEALKTEKGILNAVFNPFLVRGFDYYTGTVFEVFDTDPENRRSLFGGGRYDNLLELFGVEPIPTVGFGMGDVTIRDFLTTHNLPLKK